MNRVIALIILTFCHVLHAQDSGQYLNGEEFFSEIEKYKTSDKGQLNIDPETPVEKRTDFNSSDLLQGDVSSNQFIPTSTGGDAVISSDELTLSGKRREAKTNFGFNYLMLGDAEFQNDGGVFKKTFVDDPKRVHIGPIILSWERLLGRAFIIPMIGMNAGLSYYRGRGVFISDGTYSNAFFNLWMIPVDLGVGLGFRFWDAVGLKAMVGPTAMGLIQVRSDLESSEKGKSRRQIGLGYFASGKVQFNLSRIFPQWGIEYYRDYQATGGYIDLIARTEKYTSFQDPVEFSATYFGLGFSFDFL